MLNEWACGLITGETFDNLQFTKERICF